MRTYKGSRSFQYKWQLGRWTTALTRLYNTHGEPGISITKRTNWRIPKKSYSIRISRWVLRVDNTRWRPTLWSYLTTWEKACCMIHYALNHLMKSSRWDNKYLKRIRNYFGNKWITSYLEWGKLRRSDE